MPDAGRPAFEIRMSASPASRARRSTSSRMARSTTTARPPYFATKLLQHVAASPRHDQPSAAVGDGAGDRVADTAGGAGEQHRGARDSHEQSLDAQWWQGPDMERPPSRCSWLDKTEGLGGRVTAGNSPARAGDSPGAASSQPPHMSISQSICRTTSFPVYGRPYSAHPAVRQPIFGLFSAQRSLTMAASTSSAELGGQRGRRQRLAVEGVHPAASVILDTSQTPCAANRSAGRSAR